MSDTAHQNTDRELWRERPGDYYADSLFVTSEGSIGMDVGGSVIVMPIREWHQRATPAPPAADDAMPMLLWCPECGERHIDRGEFTTKLHHTHACQGCGHVWRPAIKPTVGVQFLPGFKDAALPASPAPAARQETGEATDKMLDAASKAYGIEGEGGISHTSRLRHAIEAALRAAAGKAGE